MTAICTVREASLSDAAIISGFNRLLAEESESKQLNKDVLRAGVEALIRDPRRGQYFVAEANGEIIGQLLITYEWSDWRNGLFWWIQSVYVASAYRRGGVFRTLYAHVEGLARARDDVCGLRLYVEHENVTARDAYVALGMATTNYRIMELEFM